jgi:hypothetical protein
MINANGGTVNLTANQTSLVNIGAQCGRGRHRAAASADGGNRRTGIR